MQLKEWHRVIIFLILFTGCLVALRQWRQLSTTAAVISSDLIPVEDKDSSAVEDTILSRPPVIEVNGIDSQMVSRVADRILSALSEADYSTLSKFVHKKRGLHFAPYAYLHDGQQVLDKETLHEGDTSTVRVWGSFDGSGDPIELTWGDYHNRFVFDKDFDAADKIEFQVFSSFGNSLNNLRDYFNGSYNMSYYVEGTEQYGGMDWAQLKLVFDVIDGHLYLIALVHDQWTI